jgi:3-oxoacyl-[acyl-carrier protein] reductase
MGQLDGRTVLITGAARGIGAACARRLAADGARLVLADLDAGVEKVAAELGQVAIRADVTRREDIERMVEEPYRRWGRLDVLFNNAGVIRVQPMLDVTEAEWDRVMTVNLRAVFFVLQAASRVAWYVRIPSPARSSAASSSRPRRSRRIAAVIT